MKTSSRDRGVALVIVLGFLVLLSGLAIAFFSSVTTELKASRNYASSVSTRQLADSAVSMVMGQIREATARTGGAWASQPGMIRVYRDGTTASPKADAFFKLYSARNMVVTTSQLPSFDPGATPSPFSGDRNGDKGDVPSDWDKYPGIFADLNSPVMVTDPSNPSAPADPVFPIVDPRAKEDSLVEGFDFDTPLNQAVDGGSPDKWRIPMPARWIYVLRDGTLTTPNKEYEPKGGGTGAEWTGSATDFRTPTKENPVVGRIAFWADDDTSKININTAGGHGKQADSPTGYDNGYNRDRYAGSFWDTPRVYTNFDIGQTYPSDSAADIAGTLIPGVGAGGLASTQPYQREYQRYPGHPATTSLGAVFSKLLTSEQIYKLAPRLAPEGSKGGTVRTRVATAVELLPKPERLYASLDELLYSESTVGGGKRETNDKYLGTSGAITPDKLEKMKFFLTPHSRAPDLNLFGRPRVAIWPVNQSNDEATGRNGFDRAIAFCSTVGGKKFIFTRTPNSGALSTQSDILASGSYSRNSDLLKYLRALTDTPIPGFGGTFKAKYGIANRDMILGQIFDYIRIANLRDTTDGMASYQFAKKGVVAPSRADVFGTNQKIGGFGRFATISEAALVFYCSGVEVVAGAKDPNGKDITPNQVYQGLVRAEDRDKISARYMRAFLILPTFHPMQGYAPIVTPSADNEKQVYEVTGLDSLKANGDSLFPSGTLSNKVNWTSGSTWAGRNFGGYEGFVHTLATHGDPNSTNPNSAPYEFSSERAAALLPPVKIPVDQANFNDKKFAFTSGKVTVKVRFGPSQLVQTIELDFGTGTWPVPKRWYRTDQGGFVADPNARGSNVVFNNRAEIESAQMLLDHVSRPDPFDPKSTGRRLPGRITWALKDNANPNVDPKSEYNGIYGSNRYLQIIQPGDVVRSLVYGKYTTSTTDSGDLRVLALTPPETVVKDFQKHPDYDSTTLHFAHGLRAAAGNLYISKTGYWNIDAKTTRGENPKGALVDDTGFGKHVSTNVAISATRAMQLPYSQTNKNGVNGVVRSSDKRAGDFDTGLGVFPDGPYGGKQDEGNVIFKFFHEPTQEWRYPIPYAGTQEYEPPGDIFFSPNRQMPSPGLFGSLLSRPVDGKGWETLAFCPNTVGERHPGNMISPRDHLLLDLFTMPFVEPYLISEPLSTAGRVNLNYQIAPFGYIKRSTGLRAALASLRVSAIDPKMIGNYKSGENIGGTTRPLSKEENNIRFAINRDETIRAIDGFFNRFYTDPPASRTSTGFFKSASEICERFLYPIGKGVQPIYQVNTPVYDPVLSPAGEPGIIGFWRDRTLTGDNLREKPYTDLYPRITTKSNTYTVHMRVQTIRQIGTDGDFSKWREGKDVILGEFRGATTIERFIDPSDRRFDQNNPETKSRGDFVDVTTATFNSSNPTTRSLEDIYRFRVVGTKRFAP